MDFKRPTKETLQTLNIIKESLLENNMNLTDEMIDKAASLLGNYTIIPNSVLFSDELKPMEFRVYTLILGYSFGARVDCSPSITRLASRCKCTNTTISSTLKALQNKSLIIIEEDPGRNNIYHINSEPWDIPEFQKSMIEEVISLGVLVEKQKRKDEMSFKDKKAMFEGKEPASPTVQNKMEPVRPNPIRQDGLLGIPTKAVEDKEKERQVATEVATEVNEFLNERKKHYFGESSRPQQVKKEDVNNMLRLLKQGYTIKDFKNVIEKKGYEWKDNDFIKERGLFRTVTLFSEDKFETYLEQAQKPIMKNGINIDEYNALGEAAAKNGRKKSTVAFR